MKIVHVVKGTFLFAVLALLSGAAFAVTGIGGIAKPITTKVKQMINDGASLKQIEAAAKSMDFDVSVG